MARITVKSSTVFVSVDDETRVFRSVDEVPPEWRRKFERPKGGLKPQTILIADRKGKEEIMRSLQGKSSSVTTRWKGSASHASAGASGIPRTPGVTAARVTHANGLTFRQQIWVEVGFVVILAGLICAAFAN